MSLSPSADDSESRFAAYVEALGAALGHADRIAPARRYCAGLLLPGDRKSIEPMAARVEPGRVQATHQSLHHLVAKADWSDAAVLAVVRTRVLPAIEQHGPIQAWIIDDTGFPKKGAHSVGGFLGYLAAQEDWQDDAALRRAMTYGSVLASFNVEEFGTERVSRLTSEEIDERFERFREITALEAAPA